MTRLGSTHSAVPYRNLPVEIPGLVAIGAERAARLVVNIDGAAMTARGRYVSGGYFEALRTTPLAGRLIVANDDRAGSAPVAVLSYELAAQQFANVAEAVGAAIRVGQDAVTVVGILPPGFDGVTAVDLRPVADDRRAVWLPLTRSKEPALPGAIGPTIVARLADGTSRSRAESALQFLVEGLNRASAEREPLTAVRLAPFHRFDPSMTLVERFGGAVALMAVPMIFSPSPASTSRRFIFPEDSRGRTSWRCESLLARPAPVSRASWRSRRHSSQSPQASPHGRSAVRRFV
jgi:hypothetical protein